MMIDLAVGYCTASSRRGAGGRGGVLCVGAARLFGVLVQPRLRGAVKASSRRVSRLHASGPERGGRSSLGFYLFGPIGQSADVARTRRRAALFHCCWFGSSRYFQYEGEEQEGLQRSSFWSLGSRGAWGGEVGRCVQLVVASSRAWFGRRRRRWEVCVWGEEE